MEPSNSASVHENIPINLSRPNDNNVDDPFPSGRDTAVDDPFPSGRDTADNNNNPFRADHPREWMNSALLTRSRAAEHVLHAIASGRQDLITHGVLECLGNDAVLEESETAFSSWTFAGHSFVQSGAAAVLGAAAVVTAPLEVPTLLFGGAALALTHGLSALGGADEELARLANADAFRRQYGFERSELLWSVVPAATLYWYLAEGDTVLELACKAKRGTLGLGEDSQTLGKILRRLMASIPGDAPTRANRLERAIVKSARDMGIDPSSSELAAAWRVVAAMRGQQKDHHTAAAKEAEASVADQADDFDEMVLVPDPSEEAAVGQSSQRSEPAQDSGMCVCCMERLRTHALVPCGHRALCERCVDQVELVERVCPICRADVRGSLRVFDP